MSRAEESLLAAIGRVGAAPAGWLRELRRQGAERFGALGLPTAKMEEWRYTSLARLADLVLAPADPGAQLPAASLLGDAEKARRPRLVFVNGRLRPELSSPGPTPPGAFVGSLAQALREDPGALEPFLGRLADAEGNAFAALNTALAEDGAFIRLEDGVALEEPIEIVFAIASGGEPVVASPRLLLVAGAGARATVVESYLGAGAGPSLTVAVAEVSLGDGARVEHYKVQDEPERAFHVGVLAARQGEASRFTTHQTSLGALLSRSEVKVVLGGEGGEARVDGLYMASGDQVVDNHSLIEHARPRCRSRETYKGILDGRARGVFGGRIRVLEGAQKSDAYQLNSNLLLSEDAEVDTKPQLEIFADDVKCGHGGTVGQIDEDALFYLRSRGLSRQAARSLLTWAFASEMLGLVGPPELRRRLGKLVSRRLPEGEGLLREAA